MRSSRWLPNGGRAAAPKRTTNAHMAQWAENGEVVVVLSIN
jgi:hypothetical protein